MEKFMIATEEGVEALGRRGVSVYAMSDGQYRAVQKFKKDGGDARYMIEMNSANLGDVWVEHDILRSSLKPKADRKPITASKFMIVTEEGDEVIGERGVELYGMTGEQYQKMQRFEKDGGDARYWLGKNAQLLQRAKVKDNALVTSSTESFKEFRGMGIRRSPVGKGSAFKPRPRRQGRKF